MRNHLWMNTPISTTLPAPDSQVGDHQNYNSVMNQDTFPETLQLHLSYNLSCLPRNFDDPYSGQPFAFQIPQFFHYHLTRLCIDKPYQDEMVLVSYHLLLSTSPESEFSILWREL